MIRNSLCLSTVFLGTTFATSLGSQKVFANPPKAATNSMKNMLEEEQKSNLTEYWKNKIKEEHLLNKIDAVSKTEKIKNIFTDLLNPINLLSSDQVREKFEYKDNKTLYAGNNLGFNSKVLSMYVMEKLKSESIKSYIMTFDEKDRYGDKNGKTTYVVIYAVLGDDGKEKWYVCDMEMASANILIGLLKGKICEYIKEADINDFCHHLEVYARNCVYIPDRHFFRCAYNIKSAFGIELSDYAQKYTKNTGTCVIYSHFPMDSHSYIWSLKEFVEKNDSIRDIVVNDLPEDWKNRIKK